MNAVYIVDDTKVAKILVDPMRRAILDLLREKPMTQAALANELGLSGASLNYHIKILRSKRLVVIAKKEIERHRIMQIFFSTIAYLFVYDLDSLPKNISRYFYPISLERARAIVSLLMVKDSYAYRIEQSPEAINILSERLSRLLLKTAKSYKKKVIGHGEEKIIYEIYTKTISNFLNKVENSS
jgi:DNA-binding transcriptional ArsR family regulator